MTICNEIWTEVAEVVSRVLNVKSYIHFFVRIVQTLTSTYKNNYLLKNGFTCIIKCSTTYSSENHA